MTHFPGVTLLVTHYNRSQSLECCLQAFQEFGCAFDDIVVADDASALEHLERLQTLQKKYSFRLITTPVNRGLGHNLNQGQDAVTTPYTLYVQEDFCPTPLFPARFQDALAIMEERPDVDLIRFYSGSPYPYRKPFKNGFSEMLFSIVRPGRAKFYYYSDWPHLRRSTFFQKFGRYAEIKPAVKSEKYMLMSYLQAHGKSLECDSDLSSLFIHGNVDAEPSTQDYSAFFAIKRRIPALIFEALWTLKLTVQFLFKSYRR